MLWLRQMAIALISLVGVGGMFGVVGAAVSAVIGPTVAPPAPFGSIAGGLVLAAGLFLAHRMDVAVERWDANRSGRALGS